MFVYKYSYPYAYMYSAGANCKGAHGSHHASGVHQGNRPHRVNVIGLACVSTRSSHQTVQLLPWAHQVSAVRMLCHRIQVHRDIRTSMWVWV